VVNVKITIFGDFDQFSAWLQPIFIDGSSTFPHLDRPKEKDEFCFVFL
jgi:hypothetical protein